MTRFLSLFRRFKELSIKQTDHRESSEIGDELAPRRALYAITITSNIPKNIASCDDDYADAKTNPSTRAYHIFPYNNAVVDRSLMHSSTPSLCSSSRFFFSSSLLLFFLYFYIPALLVYLFSFALRAPSLFFSLSLSSASRTLVWHDLR